MRLSPQPRTRFYGSRKIFPALALRLFRGRLRQGHGPLSDLAHRVAETTGAGHALCVAQARLGLFLALRALISPGQKVILSPYTIFDVVNMVICAGGRPVFADLERGTCHIDATQIERLIDRETGAVIATHLNGLVCDIERIAEICRANGVALIEDAAQCFGGRLGGRHVGTFGDVGIFSFSRAKNVNTIFGGMVVTDDGALHRTIADAMAAYPYEDTSRLIGKAAHSLLGCISTGPVVFQAFTFPLFRYDCLRDGRLVDRLVQAESQTTAMPVLPDHYERRMTPLQAELALLQLDDVERHAAQRIAYARRYWEGLRDLPQVGVPAWRDDVKDVYLNYPIQIADRQAVVKHMMRRGRDVRAHYYRNLADEPCFEAYFKDCPHARRTADRVVLLPTYPSYGMSEVDKNVAVLRGYLRGRTDPAGTS